MYRFVLNVSRLGAGHFKVGSTYVQMCEHVYIDARTYFQNWINGPDVQIVNTSASMLVVV
jgi:hypothetical protein